MFWDCTFVFIVVIFRFQGLPLFFPENDTFVITIHRNPKYKPVAGHAHCNHACRRARVGCTHTQFKRYSKRASVFQRRLKAGFRYKAVGSLCYLAGSEPLHAKRGARGRARICIMHMQGGGGAWRPRPTTLLSSLRRENESGSCQKRPSRLVAPT